PALEADSTRFEKWPARQPLQRRSVTVAELREHALQHQTCRPGGSGLHPDAPSSAAGFGPAVHQHSSTSAVPSDLAGSWPSLSSPRLQQFAVHLVHLVDHPIKTEILADVVLPCPA